jgi:8-oxo-dGTP pyrophosphatase MutT (NUDIX family)
MNEETGDAPEQAGAIPWKLAGSGIEVLLITSSHGSRWIAPKGWIEQGHSAREAARQETYEEAGVEGILSPSPVGFLDYRRGERILRVEMYTMEVTEVHVNWPEDHLRQRIWLCSAQAALVAAEPGLARLIRKLELLLLGGARPVKAWSPDLRRQRA